MNYIVNELLMDVISGTHYRILWQNESDIYLIDIDSISSWPVLIKRNQLNYKLYYGEWEKTKVENIEKIFIPSNKALKKRDEIWGIIGEVLKMEPEIYIDKYRFKILKDLCEEKGYRLATLYNYLKKYWKQGMDKNVFLPRNHKKGGVGKAKNLEDTKVGRPRKDGKGININSEIKMYIKKSLEEHYFNNKENTKAFAYERMIETYFIDKIHQKDDIKLTNVKGKDEIPTYEQFLYWANKFYNLEEDISKRYKRKKFERDYRNKINSSSYQTFGPGSRFEIDSTPANIYIVHPYFKEKGIGKPTIYIVVDVFSHLITGFYVGCESLSSWNGGLISLINTVTNKVELCKKYGVNIKAEEWPAHFLPKAILADKGEFLSYNADRIVDDLDVDLENAASYRADMKGTVEKLLDLIPLKLKPFVPGYVMKDHTERGGRDTSENARLTLNQLTTLLIYSILRHNSSVIMDYKLTKEMVLDRVRPIPTELWKWGIKKGKDSLKSITVNDAYLNLLPKGIASVTGKGIKFNGRNYTCNKALDENWFATAKLKGTWKENILYDPRIVNTILLESNEGLISCTLIEHQERFLELTEEEARILLEMEKDQKKEDKHFNLQQNVYLNNTLEQETEKFVKMNSNSTLNKNINKKQLRENKKTALEIERKENDYMAMIVEEVQSLGIEEKELDEFEEYYQNRSLKSLLHSKNKKEGGD